MHKVLKLARREYRASVRTRGFIVGLVLAPVLMGGGLIAMLIFEEHVDTTDKRLAVIDHSGMLAAELVQAAAARNATEVYDAESGKKVKPAYTVEVVEAGGVDPARLRLELSDRIRRGEIAAFLEIGPEVLHPGSEAETSGIAYHSPNAAMDELRSWIRWPINQTLRSQRLADAGVAREAMDDILAWIEVRSMGLVSRDEVSGMIEEARETTEGEAVGVPMAMMFIMFLMVMMGAMPLLNSVMEEKNQRIAEVMLGSARPFEFMMGKILGGVAVSLTAAAVYVLTAVLVFQRMELTQYLPLHILPWFFSYTVLMILMLGSMLAALGSTCSDAKDAQSMVLPAMLPVMVPMFVLGPVLENPSGSMATWLSLCPPFTPMLMLLRQATPGGVPAWQPWVGLAGVIVVSLLAVWVGGRIFRVGILMQGKPPRLPEILRWAWQG